MTGIPSIGMLIYLLLGGVVAGILSSAASFASLASYPLLLSVGEIGRASCRERV